MTKVISQFVEDESGATAIEYALLAAGIGIVILAGIGTLAGAINGALTTAANNM